MRARWRNWTLWIVAAATALFVLIDWGASVFVTVPCERSNDYSHEQAEAKLCASLRSTILKGREPVLYSVGGWLDIHNGAVTGVATVFLTIITWRLVVLGGEQAKTTRAQLRAYINMRATAVVSENGNIRCECMLKNTGTTPASRVRDSFAVWVDDYPTGSWKTPEETAEAEATAIGPADELVNWDDVETSADDLRAIRRGVKAIYAVSKVIYADTFGHEWVTEAKWHMTGDAIDAPGDRRMQIDDYSAT